MEIIGIDNRYRGVFLAHFVYSGTCEGKTVESQLIYDNKFSPQFKEDEKEEFLNQLEIGWNEDEFPPEIIPAVVEKEFHKAKFLDWNDRFKAKFFESFGYGVWLDFLNATSSGDYLNLICKRYYNLG